MDRFGVELAACGGMRDADCAARGRLLTISLTGSSVDVEVVGRGNRRADAPGIDVGAWK